MQSEKLTEIPKTFWEIKLKFWRFQKIYIFSCGTNECWISRTLLKAGAEQLTTR